MSESKNSKALIPLSSKPHTALDHSLQRVDKILAKSWTPEQLKVIEFYERNPIYFKNFMSFLHPLSEEILERYNQQRGRFGSTLYNELKIDSKGQLNGDYS